MTIMTVMTKDRRQYLGVSGLRLIGREMHVRHRTAGCVVSESTVTVGGMLIGVGSQVIVGSM